MANNDDAGDDDDYDGDDNATDNLQKMPKLTR